MRLRDRTHAGRMLAEQLVRRRALAYRGGRPLPPLTGRTVILVDDGVATGSTARAAARAARQLGAAQLVLAAPVIAAPSRPELGPEFDAHLGGAAGSPSGSRPAIQAIRRRCTRPATSAMMASTSKRWMNAEDPERFAEVVAEFIDATDRAVGHQPDVPPRTSHFGHLPRKALT